MIDKILQELQQNIVTYETAIQKFLDQEKSLKASGDALTSKQILEGDSIIELASGQGDLKNLLDNLLISKKIAEQSRDLFEQLKFQQEALENQRGANNENVSARLGALQTLLNEYRIIQQRLLVKPSAPVQSGAEPAKINLKVELDVIQEQLQVLQKQLNELNERLQGFKGENENLLEFTLLTVESYAKWVAFSFSQRHEVLTFLQKCESKDIQDFSVSRLIRYLGSAIALFHSSQNTQDRKLLEIVKNKLANALEKLDNTQKNQNSALEQKLRALSDEVKVHDDKLNKHQQESASSFNAAQKQLKTHQLFIYSSTGTLVLLLFLLLGLGIWGSLVLRPYFALPVQLADLKLTETQMVGEINQLHADMEALQGAQEALSLTVTSQPSPARILPTATEINLTNVENAFQATQAQQAATLENIVQDNTKIAGDIEELNGQIEDMQTSEFIVQNTLAAISTTLTAISPNATITPAPSNTNTPSTAEADNTQEVDSNDITAVPTTDLSNSPVCIAINRSASRRNIRETAPSGRQLGSLETNEDVKIIGFVDGANLSTPTPNAWLQVEYTSSDGTIIQGWIAYLELETEINCNETVVTFQQLARYVPEVNP